MNRGLATIIGIIALFLTLLGLSVAYAEEFRVDVPFEFNESGCTLTDNENFWEYQCIITGQKATQENPFEPDLVWDIKEQIYKTPEQLEEEAKAIYEQWVEDRIEKLSPEDQIIARIMQEENPSTADEELVDLLKKLGAVCRYDIATIQTYDEFDVPTEIITDADGNQIQQLYKRYDISAINLETHQALKKLRLAIETCIGQATLHEITGAQYQHMVVDDINTYNRHHGDMPPGTFIYPTQQLTEQDFRDSKGIAANTICSSQMYPEVTKRMYGCPDRTVYGENLWEMSVKDYAKSNPVLKEFLKYSNGETQDQLHKNINKAKDNKVATKYGGQ